MSPLSTKQRSKKYRENLQLSAAKLEASKEAQSNRYYKRVQSTLTQKLIEAFQSNYDKAKIEGNVRAGWHFTVENCINFTYQECIELKKGLKQPKQWYGLGQVGRNFTKNTNDSLINNVTDKKFPLLSILRNVFDQKSNVSCMKFIKHSKDLHETQPFHVDDKAQYKLLQKMDSQDLEKLTFHDFGYSVFVGLDKVNTLIVGRANEESQDIENIMEIQFKFKSILVIATHLPHQGNKFSSMDNVYHTKDKRTKFSLKGFVAIGDDPLDGQGWFVKGREIFCGPR